MLLAQSLLLGMLVVWLLVTALTIGVWIYRAVLGLREEDALFIDPGEERLLKEQAELSGRMEALRPWLVGGVAASILLGLLTFAYWVYVRLAS
jgi:hypothetical protein